MEFFKYRDKILKNSLITVNDFKVGFNLKTDGDQPPSIHFSSMMKITDEFSGVTLINIDAPKGASIFEIRSYWPMAAVRSLKQKAPLGAGL